MVEPDRPHTTIQYVACALHAGYHFTIVQAITFSSRTCVYNISRIYGAHRFRVFDFRFCIF